MNSTSDPEGPGMVPPDGVVPDFDNPGGSHTIGIAIVTVGLLIATFSVAVRFASKTIARNFKISDFLVFASWAQYLGYQAIMYKCSIFPSIARHQWNVRLKDISYINYNVYVETLLYGTIMLCLKLAILIDWLQLFVPAGQRDAMFWAIHALIWGNAAFYLVGLFADIFQCIPSEKIWNVFYEGGTCNVDIAANNFSAVLINLVSDIAIFILPQWRIWRLNMSFQRKIGVSVVFAAGILVTVLGALRFISLVPLIDSDDQTYWLSLLGLYSSAEMGVGFLVAGLPSLPKVFHSLPFSESVVRLIRSMRNSSVRWTQKMSTNSPGPRGQGPPSRKRRGLWEITELEETELRTRDMMTMNGGDAANNIGQPSSLSVHEERRSEHSIAKAGTTDMV